MKKLIEFIGGEISKGDVVPTDRIKMRVLERMSLADAFDFLENGNEQVVVVHVEKVLGVYGG